MNAIKELKHEHQAIKTTLSILDKVTQKISVTHEIGAMEHLALLVEFFQVFVDKCHHGKEEDLLFPALMELGVSKNGGPIGVMLAEHEQGRKFVRELKKGVDQIKRKDPAAIDIIIQSANNYIVLLKNHIEKEETVLFALADQHLSKEKQDQLYKGFENIEQEKIGIGKHEEFHSLLDQLSLIYLS